MPGAILLSDRMEARFGPALERVAPESPRVVLAPDGPKGDPTAVEIAFFSGDLYPERTRDFVLTVAQAKELRWLQSFSAGIDHPWFQSLRARGVRLSTGSGAAAVPIAHTVLLYLLALSRNLTGWLDAQHRRAWEPHPVAELEGRTLGILGLGPIGLEVARLGVAFRMRVIGLRRTPRGDEPCETWPLSRLHELLPRADALVLALPLTESTRRIVGERELALLPRGAWLMNVGRGELVDEGALVDALQSGRLGGAGLDVFEVEPLPVASPLWRLPNVIVTPHSSGVSPGNLERAGEIFVENLGRWLRGEPLRNEVV